MDTPNTTHNEWATAVLVALFAHCIEQAGETLAYFELMWGEYE